MKEANAAYEKRDLLAWSDFARVKQSVGNRITSPNNGLCLPRLETTCLMI